MGKTKVQEKKGPPKVKQKLVETGTQDFSLAFDPVADKKIYIRRVIGCFVSRVTSSVEAGTALRGNRELSFCNSEQVLDRGEEMQCWAR